MEGAVDVSVRSGAGGRGGWAAGGFTLVESLVAVGAVAVVAVVVARVSGVVGRTVALGRQSSDFLSASVAIERALRADVSAMTRDGFLLVRHEDQFGPRDEMVFFATGQFRSRRGAGPTGLVPEAGAARIYWGHGLRAEPLDPAGYGPLRPDQAAALRPVSDAGSVNADPSNWLLVRHVTLLAPPAEAPRLALDLSATGTEPRTVLETALPNATDRNNQIAGQVAAPDIFRDLAAAAAVQGNSTLRAEVSGAPRFESGMVDIASVSLGHVRAVLLEYAGAGPFAPRGQVRLATPGEPTDLASVNGTARRMIQALPADSDTGQRLRAEPVAPNPLGLGWGVPRTAARLTDQQMLASGVIAAGVTAFDIEWSFGEFRTPVPGSATQSPELIWYSDADGPPVPSLYDFQNAPATRFFPERRRPDGTIERDQDQAIGTPLAGVIQSAVHFQPAGAFGQGLYSCFGYVDNGYPVFAGPDPNIGTSFDEDVLIDNGASSSTGVTAGAAGVFDALRDRDVRARAPRPAAEWPRLLRVSVTVRDAVDPAVTRTFQYVIEVPGEGIPRVF
ncbi:MAG: hypothetical protein C0468_02030 [Planctomyces sp.]|nr:hypothetical protein [Planctomyces sp.]MBA4119232.1 hypothetical protein [Isosphaera sp.]